MTRYILRGCCRCGGDLFLHDQYRQEDDWLCMQCGRYRHQHQPPLTANDCSEDRMPQAAVQYEPPVQPDKPGK